MGAPCRSASSLKLIARPGWAGCFLSLRPRSASNRTIGGIIETPQGSFRHLHRDALDCTLSSRIGAQSFVLEIDGRPLLALSSGSIERARAMCSEAWFIEELASYRSAGRPIWNGEAEVRVRLANADEATKLEIARMQERAHAGHAFAFLGPLDPACH